MAANDAVPAFLVDGIRSIAIHNDVARVHFMQLNQEGSAEIAVTLLVPLKQVQPIVEGLKNIIPGGAPEPERAEAEAPPATTRRRTR